MIRKCTRCGALDKELQATIHVAFKNTHRLAALCQECCSDFAHFMSLIPPAYQDQLAALLKMTQEAPNPVEQKLIRTTGPKSKLMIRRVKTEGQI